MTYADAGSLINPSPMDKVTFIHRVDVRIDAAAQ
jgi:hypothetical protein